MHTRVRAHTHPGGTAAGKAAVQLPAVATACKQDQGWRADGGNATWPATPGGLDAATATHTAYAGSRGTVRLSRSSEAYSW
jgi:hypothetical protein